eukprot:445172_1
MDHEIDIIENDWKHILHSHIYEGNKMSIENVLRFFSIVVHYEDPGTDRNSVIKQCRSAIRYQNRMQSKNKTEEKVLDIEHVYTHNAAANKHIFERKQDYIQRLLDKIHCFLAHSNIEYYVQRLDSEKQKKDKHAKKLNKLSFSASYLQ